MTHPIIQDLEWRYTTKRYNDRKKVSPEDLDVLLEAIRLSASSINSQPWKFVVLESDEAKQRLIQTLGDKFQFNKPVVSQSSHVILFAHNPCYRRENYAEVVDNGIEDGRTEPQMREEAFGPFIFAEMNTDESGDTGVWTRAQIYIALGNALHSLARLKIDSTALEGIDAEFISQEFAEELGGYRCDVALAIGYRDPEEDYNAKLPKSRRRPESIFVRI
jgi:nitroreductase/dihydropteridine reductase